MVEIAIGAGTVRVAVSAVSEVGLVRQVNEDSVLARPPFFLVADGMGGHLHGDRASQETVRAVREAFPEQSLVEPPRVIEAIGAANLAVRALSDGDPRAQSLSGTTLSGVALVTADGGRSAHWMIVNVGDSRVYGWSEGGLEQLTVDHSVVQELVDSGVITAAAASVHPERHVVTRALGADEQIAADVWLVPARGQQSFVVCSDGLTKELTDTEIARVIAASREDDADPAERLVRAAVAAGGSDNVTVMMIDAETIDADRGHESLTRDRIELEASRLEDTMPRR
ncbi:MAG: serine/threonine-protein phosphatase [Micrococcales bacterium]|nr:serine/threonine-protein phosphatase [Micrococcales bacterium]